MFPGNICKRGSDLSTASTSIVFNAKTRYQEFSKMNQSRNVNRPKIVFASSSTEELYRCLQFLLYFTALLQNSRFIRRCVQIM